MTTEHDNTIDTVAKLKAATPEQITEAWRTGAIDSDAIGEERRAASNAAATAHAEHLRGQL